VIEQLAIGLNTTVALQILMQPFELVTVTEKVPAPTFIQFVTAPLLHK
jgi:hypothetical protein